MSCCCHMEVFEEPYPGMAWTMGEEILVIHQGALGDVILSFPAILALRRHRGGRPALLARNQIGPLARAVGVVDTCFDADRAFFSGLFSSEPGSDLIRFLDRFDRVVVVGFCGLEEACFPRGQAAKVVSVHPRPPAGEAIPVAFYLLKQLERANLLEADKRPFTISERRLTGDGVLVLGPTRPVGHGTQGVAEEPGGENRVIIHPGAGSGRKRWPLARFLNLASVLRGSFGGEIVFLLGPAERGLGETLSEESDRRGFSICQTGDLLEVLALVRSGSCFVGNDSGLSHLAAFVGVPTVALFGPTDPKRWAPAGDAVQVLRGAVECPPCFEAQSANCEAPGCLTEITVEMVATAVEAFRRGTWTRQGASPMMAGNPGIFH